jgi:outer membrane protein TolC
MLKHKIIGLSLFTAINLFAIDINDAITIALENNYKLKQQQYILDESKVTLDSSKTAYQPQVDLSYNYNNRDETIMGQLDEDSTLSANFSYNLFKGFSDKYNIEASKVLVNYSKLNMDAFKEDLILDVKNTYITHLKKQKNTQTLYEALKLYEKQYYDSKNNLEQGLIAQNELLEVEVEMLQAKQNYEKAKSDQKIAKKKLKNILGGKLDEDKIIEELKSSSILVSSFDKKQLENRSEIKALSQLIQSYEYNSKSIKGNFYPKVDAKLSHTRYGDDLVPNNRSNYPNNQNIGMLSLNWNLYNGKKDELSIVANKKKIKQTQMQMEDLKLQILLQYEQALEELEVSKLNLITATKAKEQAKMNYDIVKNKVQEGISTNSDLIDANYLLTKSKQNYFSAYYDKYLALATLQRVFENGAAK